MTRTPTKKPAAGKYWKVTDFATHFGITRQHAYNMIARGDIQAVRVGGAVRIPAQVVAAYEKTILATAGI